MRVFCVVAVALAVGLAAAVSPYASASPDGLEKVAERHGFLDRGHTAGLQQQAPLPDYAFPGISDPRLATGVAGFVGTLVVFVVAMGVATVLRRAHPRRRLTA
jgi:hypothetical protein